MVSNQMRIAISAILLACAAARAQEGPPTHTATEKVVVSIESQPLQEALREFGEQTGLQVLFRSENVSTRGVTAPRVAGELSARDALERLLKDSGLEYEFINERTVRVTSAPGPGASLTDQEAFGDVLRVAQSYPQAQSSDVSRNGVDDNDLEEVVVRAVQFRYEEVESANKMPMSVKDTPQSVKVVTQDLIDFAGIRKFDDIYKIDASTGAVHTGDHYPRQYYRGFEGNSAGNTIKIDGFRATDEVSLDLATFERFELVKGATSTLYGQNSVGGTLNAISKMPRDSAGGEVALEVGSFDHYRGDLDFYGPLTADGNLSYRLIGAYQDANSYMDFAHDDRVVIAPTIKYAIGENTSIIARVNYQRFEFAPYFGFGAQFLGDFSDPGQLTPENFRIPDVPRSRTGNAPSNDALKETSVEQLLLDHEFGSWKLRASAQHARTTADNNGVLMFGTDAAGLTDTLAYARDLEQDSYSAEVNLFGDVELLGRDHTLFFGLDYASLEREVFGRSGEYLVGAGSGFSILAPDYSLLSIPATRADYPSVFGLAGDHELYGFSAQAMIRPADKWIVSIGGRYSKDIEATRFSCCAAGEPFGPEEELKEDSITYQLGLTYALTPRLNLYISRGTTFEPQSGLTANGSSIDPEEGFANEIGLKGEAHGRKISYSLAIFDMERTNIAQGVPGTSFVAPIGTQRSRGVELDIRGEVMPGLEIYGSFAVLDAEYIEGEFEGVQPANAPKFGLSTFASYQIQTGHLRGLGFGVGVVHKAGRETNDFFFGYGNNTPIEFLDDFTEVDVRAFYGLRSWQFELAATNVLNEKYYSNPAGRLALGFQANPSRQVMGSVRYRF